MKYKAGDKVRVKSLEWYDSNKDDQGIVKCGEDSFISDMIKYCGLKVVITIVNYDTYRVNIDSNEWGWTDEMFEEDIPDNSKKYGEKSGDIITICQNRGLSFCYGNALKYAKRIAMVSKMKKDEQHLYKGTYHKGGQLDLDKMEDYIEREAEVDPRSAEFLFNECMEILDGIK